MFGEPESDSFAHAAAGAGHDRDLTGEKTIHCWQ